MIILHEVHLEHLPTSGKFTVYTTHTTIILISTEMHPCDSHKENRLDGKQLGLEANRCKQIKTEERGCR